MKVGTVWSHLIENITLFSAATKKETNDDSVRGQIERRSQGLAYTAS
jgi:hypothetical protein